MVLSCSCDRELVYSPKIGTPLLKTKMLCVKKSKVRMTAHVSTRKIRRGLIPAARCTTAQDGLWVNLELTAISPSSLRMGMVLNMISYPTPAED